MFTRIADHGGRMRHRDAGKTDKAAIEAQILKKETT